MNLNFNYKKYLKYLYSLKQFIIISSALFLFSIIYGYFSAKISPEDAKTTLLEFEKMFEPILEAGLLMQFIFIFFNNLTSLFLSLFLGILFGIFPLISVFSNGAMIGMFAFLWGQEFTMLEFFKGILPHGIIEIPLLIVSSAIGLKIGKTAIDKIFKKKGKIKPEIKKGLDFFLKIIILLTLLAAAIEIFITPLLF